MSISHFNTADGVSLVYEDTGSGPTMIWQHGLGGDCHQAAEVFPVDLNIRRITLECRGHGQSYLGPTEALSIAQFGADVISLLDHLGIEKAILGGISMGAAMSLQLAVTAPSRVKALILARPAWLGAPAPPAMRPFLRVAEMLRSYGRDEGLRRFEQTDELAAVEEVSPDNAESLRGFFSKPTDGVVELLSRIPCDGPGVSEQEISAISVPTLIIGTAEDYIHPLAYAASLQQTVPGARLQTITSKSVSRPRYIVEFRKALAAFLSHALLVQDTQRS